MVSGLVTSPCDQLRIFSGDARLILMASKSAIVFCISNGLERNKVFLRFLLSKAVAGYQRPVTSFLCFTVAESSSPRNVSFKTLLAAYAAGASALRTTDRRQMFSVCRCAGRGT